jgi:hypothetical protein
MRALSHSRGAVFTALGAADAGVVIYLDHQPASPLGAVGFSA